MNLTKENCPSHTAFMPLRKLQNQFENGNSMFLYEYVNASVGYFSLSVNDDSAEINNLSVLPDYRYLGIGKELVNFAVDYCKKHLIQIKLK